jgi:hypothetical protein
MADTSAASNPYIQSPVLPPCNAAKSCSSLPDSALAPYSQGFPQSCAGALITLAKAFAMLSTYIQCYCSYATFLLCI